MIREEFKGQQDRVVLRLDLVLKELSKVNELGERHQRQLERLADTLHDLQTGAQTPKDEVVQTLLKVLQANPTTDASTASTLEADPDARQRAERILRVASLRAEVELNGTLWAVHAYQSSLDCGGQERAVALDLCLLTRSQETPDPRRVVAFLDCSSSMNQLVSERAGGKSKFEVALDALRWFKARLGEQLIVIGFADRAEQLSLDTTFAGVPPGLGGRTNLSAGICRWQGLGSLSDPATFLVISDGLVNEGETNPGALRQQLLKESSASHVYALGIGEDSSPRFLSALVAERRFFRYVDQPDLDLDVTLRELLGRAATLDSTGVEVEARIEGQEETQRWKLPEVSRGRLYPALLLLRDSTPEETLRLKVRLNGRAQGGGEVRSEPVWICAPGAHPGRHSSAMAVNARVIQDLQETAAAMDLDAEDLIRRTAVALTSMSLKTASVGALAQMANLREVLDRGVLGELDRAQLLIQTLDARAPEIDAGLEEFAARKIVRVLTPTLHHRLKDVFDAYQACVRAALEWDQGFLQGEPERRSDYVLRRKCAWMDLVEEIYDWDLDPSHKAVLTDRLLARKKELDLAEQVG